MLLFKSRDTNEIITTEENDLVYVDEYDGYLRSEDTRDFYKESYEVEVFDELTLDEYVNWHRQQRLLTRKEAYTQIGLTASTYYRLEHGKMISKPHLRLVAKWLGLSVQMLPKVKGE